MSHTATHHSRYDSSGRVVSLSQRALPDNTQHSQQTDIHAPGGIQTNDLSRPAAVDLHLRSHGHWDWQYFWTVGLQQCTWKDMLSKLECTSRSCSDTGVTTYSLHPGIVDTELQRHLDDTYFRGANLFNRAFATLFFKTPEEGARTTIYCSVDEKLANQTGLYYRLEFVALSIFCTLTSSLICPFCSFLSSFRYLACSVGNKQATA